MPEDWQPPDWSDEWFDMAAAHQMALDALRVWQQRMNMPRRDYDDR